MQCLYYGTATSSDCFEMHTLKTAAVG